GPASACADHSAVHSVHKRNGSPGYLFLFQCFDPQNQCQQTDDFRFSFCCLPGMDKPIYIDHPAVCTKFGGSKKPPAVGCHVCGGNPVPLCTDYHHLLLLPDAFLFDETENRRI